jgi:hypothetical protein
VTRCASSRLAGLGARESSTVIVGRRDRRGQDLSAGPLAAGFEPAQRFEADAETLLLLHLDGDLVDASPQSHAVTGNGLVFEPECRR